MITQKEQTERRLLRFVFISGISGVKEVFECAHKQLLFTRVTIFFSKITRLNLKFFEIVSNFIIFTITNVPHIELARF